MVSYEFNVNEIEGEKGEFWLFSNFSNLNEVNICLDNWSLKVKIIHKCQLLIYQSKPNLKNQHATIVIS